MLMNVDNLYFHIKMLERIDRLIHNQIKLSNVENIIRRKCYNLSMILSLIAAIGKNNEIGKGNQLLWKMPADMKHFRTITSGHTVIMGRKTFESIGRPLQNRKNIVITRDAAYMPEGVDVMYSLNEALKLAALERGRKFEENQDEVEIFVIGGGEIYKQALPLAQKLYITHIDATLDADVFFPVIGPEWKKMSEDSHPADAENEYPFSFVEYKKIAG